MKWVLFALLLGAIPALNQFFRSQPDKAPYGWFALGFLPFVLGPWHLMMAPVSWGMWSGYVKGMEYTALDSLAIAILMGPGRGRAAMPFALPIVAYMVAVALAITQSSLPFPAFFYLWQLARVFLVTAAVARVASVEGGSDAIIKGLIAGLAYQAVFAFNGRLNGELRSGGTLGDKNLLGFISHMCVLPAFGLLLAHRFPRWGAVGLAAGAAVAILTGSRATMGLMPAGLGLVYLLSLARRWSARKAAAGVGMLLVLAIAAPFAQKTLSERLAIEQATYGTNDDYDERAAFERAAWMMIADHPLGVGANMYVQTANLGGYSDRAGVIWSFGSRAANVHNTYLLITAETGWLGLITFLLLMVTAVITALRAAFQYRADPRGELLIALGAALVTISLHCFVEWIFVMYSTQYAFGITLGLIGGIIYQLKHKRAQATQTVDGPPGQRFMLSPRPQPAEMAGQAQG